MVLVLFRKPLEASVILVKEIAFAVTKKTGNFRLVKKQCKNYVLRRQSLVKINSQIKTVI